MTPTLHIEVNKASDEMLTGRTRWNSIQAFRAHVQCPTRISVDICHVPRVTGANSKQPLLNGASEPKHAISPEQAATCSSPSDEPTKTKGINAKADDNTREVV